MHLRISGSSFFPSLPSQDPPTVSIETSRLTNLEDRKDSATLRCVADANPPAAVEWRKEGLGGVFGADPEIVFSPVSRHSAGTYACVAHNQLGRSEKQFVELDVKCEFFILEKKNLFFPQKCTIYIYFLFTQFPPPSCRWARPSPSLP